MTERSTRGQTNRRNDLNPNAPPFHPRHNQQQRSQQSRTTLPTQSHSQSQSNKDKINTLFQIGLLRLTESPLLNDDEWKTFCNKLDELTRTIAQLCDKDRLQGRRDNNNRNGQRGYRQREASQPGRRPNRINGRERRIREMVDIQKLYRKNPKQAMQQIKQEPPPLRCQIPVLMEMLCQTGVGPHTRDIIRDIYTNSTMCVRTADGMTAPIQCNKGVKQGCPLSPILFNLVMEPLIRAVDTIHSAGYTIGNHTIRSLAYADDLCILTQSTSEMQEVLQATQRASNWAGLTFNPRKCGTHAIQICSPVC